MYQVLQPPNHLGGPPLDHLQFFKVSLELRGNLAEDMPDRVA